MPVLVSIFTLYILIYSHILSSVCCASIFLFKYYAHRRNVRTYNQIEQSYRLGDVIIFLFISPPFCKFFQSPALFLCSYILTFSPLPFSSIHSFIPFFHYLLSSILSFILFFHSLLHSFLPFSPSFFS